MAVEFAPGITSPSPTCLRVRAHAPKSRWKRLSGIRDIFIYPLPIYTLNTGTGFEDNLENQSALVIVCVTRVCIAVSIIPSHFTYPARLA